MNPDNPDTIHQDLTFLVRSKTLPATDFPGPTPSVNKQGREDDQNGKRQDGENKPQILACAKCVRLRKQEAAG